MKCRTLAQLQPPSPDPAYRLLAAIFELAARDAASRNEWLAVPARTFLASPEVRAWAEMAMGEVER